MHSPPDNRPLDSDLAALVVQLPVCLARLALLIVAGLWNDWRARV